MSPKETIRRQRFDSSPDLWIHPQHHPFYFVFCCSHWLLLLYNTGAANSRHTFLCKGSACSQQGDVTFYMFSGCLVSEQLLTSNWLMNRNFDPIKKRYSKIKRQSLEVCLYSEKLRKHIALNWFLTFLCTRGSVAEWWLFAYCSCNLLEIPEFKLPLLMPLSYDWVQLLGHTMYIATCNWLSTILASLLVIYAPLPNPDDNK